MNLFINIRDFLYYNRKIILIFLFICIVIFFYLFYEKNKNYNEELFLNNDIYINEIEEDIQEKYIVDIKGAVKFPGTYELEAGKRITDVINLAGGIIDNADLSTINLSKKISDEMLIIIPKVSESFNNNYDYNNVVNNDGKVSINYGTLNSLMSINGIGEVKAQAIIDYRNNNGLFENIEDIKNVNCIGNSTFEKIKDYIKL